jgi:competence ComEA-like helix-hairpin-helix protein
VLDVTPQERLALVVIATLIAGGALARHAVFTAHAREAVIATPDPADSVNASSGSALQRRVAEEVERTSRGERPPAAPLRVDPNSATVEQLAQLPRIGPAIAGRIVAFRSGGGRFRTTGDLLQVTGIGPALLQAIEPHLALERGAAVAARPPPARAGRSPPVPAANSAGRITLNSATVEQLQTLPGVGAVIAGRIVEYRQANGPFRTFQELEKVRGIGPRLRERLEAVARLGT